MKLLTTLSVAKRLRVKPDAVRYLERIGKLIAIKVERGEGHQQRLFLEEEVLRFERQRDAHKVARVAKEA